MNAPWVALAAAWLLGFVYFEWRALRHPDRYNTLSRAIYDLGSKFPLSIFLLGFVAGGLVVHFYWHWCPDLMPPGTGG
jgi:hypothetical protein